MSLSAAFAACRAACGSDGAPPPPPPPLRRCPLSGCRQAAELLGDPELRNHIAHEQRKRCTRAVVGLGAWPAGPAPRLPVGCRRRRCDASYATSHTHLPAAFSGPSRSPKIPSLFAGQVQRGAKQQVCLHGTACRGHGGSTRLFEPNDLKCGRTPDSRLGRSHLPLQRLSRPRAGSQPTALRPPPTSRQAARLASPPGCAALQRAH